MISLRLTGDRETGPFIESVADNTCPGSKIEATKIPETTAWRIAFDEPRSVDLGILADMAVSVTGDGNRVGLRLETKVRHVVKVEGEKEITGFEGQATVVGLAYPFIGEQAGTSAAHRSN